MTSKPQRRKVVAIAGYAAVAGVGLVILGFWLASSTPAAQTEARTPAPITSQASEPAAVEAPVAQEASAALPAATQRETLPTFSGRKAMKMIRKLERFGPRKGGSVAERRAAKAIATRLRDLGYDARIEKFRLPTGKVSRNVVARLRGRSDSVVVLGAHMDSKPPAPGANDNLSGCGVLLEVARVLAAAPPTATVEFVFFGSEEVVDSNPNHHHLGSRHRVKKMTGTQKRAIAGMISVDMVGRGSDFTVRTMKRGPQSLRKRLVREAKKTGLPASYLKDPGKTGWSDHEPYELAGIPAAWLEWRPDNAYHSARDRSDRLKKKRIRQTGRFVLKFVRDLDEGDLARLKRSSRAK